MSKLVDSIWTENMKKSEDLKIAFPLMDSKVCILLSTGNTFVPYIFVRYNCFTSVYNKDQCDTYSLKKPQLKYSWHLKR